MSWWKRDQEAQEQNETLSMPRELTPEELEAEKRREALTRPSAEDKDLPWYSR